MARGEVRGRLARSPGIRWSRTNRSPRRDGPRAQRDHLCQSPGVIVPPPPSGTYRLQFHAGFTFEDARRLVPYLNDLGVSHIYASPYLRARSGSTHGYDVADPSSLNPELGTQEHFAAIVAPLQKFAIGHLLHAFPNHMRIADP